MMSKVVPVTELRRGWWVFNPGLINKEIAEVIDGLLRHLPDSQHEDDQSWGYCWDALSDAAQDEVIAARDIAEGMLYALREENDG